MMQPKTEHQTRKQVINATAFVVSVTATYLANALMNVDLSQITEDYSLTISPAGWAFSIWGLIYSLITVFVVYQALTDKCATSRNNELIYNNINYWFAANFAIGSIWVFMFQLFSTAGFVIALIVILGMLVTAIVVLDKASKVKVSVTELIGLRIGFSIYAGWLTTATILNVMFVLKSFGLYADPLEKEAETKFGVAVLCFAECLFIGLSLWLRNPLYAAVWLWAMGAIRNNNKEYENIQTTCLVLLIIHGVYVLGLTAWLVLKKVKKEESKGLFC